MFKEYGYFWKPLGEFNSVFTHSFARIEDSYIFIIVIVLFSCLRYYLAACLKSIFHQNKLSKHFLKAASSSVCPLRFILLHILSARPAAEMTHYISAEDQQLNKVYSSWLSPAHVPDFTLFALSTFSLLFFFRMLTTFLLSKEVLINTFPLKMI